MSTAAEDFAGPVALGVAVLDEHDPGWWREDTENAVDLGSLRLEEAGRCVLGQRCPASVLAAYATRRYADDRYLAYLGELSRTDDWSARDWSAQHGFTLAHGGALAWDALTAEWKRVITERRSAP